MLFLSLCHDHGHWKLPRVASRLIGVQLFNYYFFQRKKRHKSQIDGNGHLIQLLIYKKFRHNDIFTPTPLLEGQGCEI